MEVNILKTDDSLKVNGSPTKDLFISMLVKDITLRDAIGDLIDNSVDAANKHAKSRMDLSQFEIKINATKDEFEMIDNCGGLEVEVAKNSAFCFGKPKNYSPGKHTIGQFGIGMKRAFFKMGNLIEVNTVALNSSFFMKIDVKEWRDREDIKDWDFHFDNTTENKHKLSNTKTEIKIIKLTNDASNQFNDKEFWNQLREEIALEQLYTINKGLKIYINDSKLRKADLSLRYNNEVKPSYWKHQFESGLSVEIIVGVGEDKGVDGGYYVFCNDRVILPADKSEDTGWTGGGKGLPIYHDQFYLFRGYVFFEADDSSKLPWNTTKTGMNLDSPEYLFVRERMIIMGRAVITMLNKMKRERENDNPEENRILSNKIANATLRPITQVRVEADDLPPIFEFPNIIGVAKKNKSGRNISFNKPEKQVKKAMEYFNVGSANLAGEKAFDFFYQNEIGE